MTRNLVDQIATAVLYEGYLLYPYRATAVKNRQRFNFGVLVPESYSQAQSGAEACRMQTECLVRGDRASIRARIRFLQLVDRQVEKFAEFYREGTDQRVETSAQQPGECVSPIHDPAETAPPGQTLSVRSPNRALLRSVDFLEHNGLRYQSWQEAIEREVASMPLNLQELVTNPKRIGFVFGPDNSIELIGADLAQPAGRLVRTQREIRGVLSLSATRVDADVYRIQVAVENKTLLPNAAELLREQALASSFASTHAVLTVHDGQFVSLLEPPDELAQAAQTCRQAGCWPVLVGEPGDRSTMLASPIILYDYPEVAAESPGDFFDGTEMDEMLMLRVMTMTAEEHREMRQVDEQARRLLERTQSLSEEDLMKLHGTIRGLRSIDPSPKEAESHGVTTKS